MHPQDMVVLIATVLTALAECPSRQTREGILYAGLMGRTDLDSFMRLLRIMANAKWINRGPQFLIELTDEGYAMAQKIEQAVASKS